MTRKGQIDIYNELDNFVEENMGEVTHTEIARHFFELGRNNAIDKACFWLLEWETHQGEDIEVVEQFRKAMEGSNQ